MKKLLSVCLMLISLEGFAQDSKYQVAMVKWVKYFNDSLLNRENSEVLMNTFERIGKVEKNQWMPYYYAAHCATTAADLEKDDNKADELTARAEEFLDIVDQLSPKNPESKILRAYVAYTQINVDFVGRGIKNSNLAEKLLFEALKIDKENPRAYFLLGMGKYARPEQYGGSKALACEYFAKAIEYDKPQTDQLAPIWHQYPLGTVKKYCDQRNKTNTQK